MRSFYDEAPTDDFEPPTHMQGMRPERTMIAIDDPEPTMPPDEVVANPIERYEIDRLLGEGSFGRVYAARDTKLGRKVALKLLHDEYLMHPEIRQRFLQEAHAAACIEHPGIVTMFDVGDAAAPYLAMELLAGQSLLERIKHGPMSPTETRAIGRQVASALGAAHRQGVLHRDLKPENIFIVRDPAAVGGERVKVLDFGLAKPTHGASVKTRVATVFGTPIYMAPEQFTQTPNTDPRSDIYALGCVLYHLATGRPPYRGSLREVVTQHREAPVPLVPDPALDAIVRRMLAKDPARRFQTMADVEYALVEERPSMPEITMEIAKQPRLGLLRLVAVLTVAAAAAALTLFV
jgi:serine/threonine protein kinase